MTRKVKFFTISIGLLYSRIFFPLICVIKCFMNLMLLHWILVKFCMEGQINRLGPYDYSWNIVYKAFVKMLIWLALSIVLCSHFWWMVIQIVLLCGLKYCGLHWKARHWRIFQQPSEFMFHPASFMYQMLLLCYQKKALKYSRIDWSQCMLKLARLIFNFRLLATIQIWYILVCRTTWIICLHYKH